MIVEAPVRRWTRDEYYRMAEAGILRPEDRVELIDGEILTMAPQKSPHATAMQLAQEALREAFGAGFVVRPQLPLVLDELNEPEPDLAVVRGEPRDYRDAHPTTALLVVEVAESSLGFDRGVKSRLYAHAGIPEYWIVDLAGGALEVLRSPAGGEYRERRVLHHGASIAPLARPDTPIAVADLLP